MLLKSKLKDDPANSPTQPILKENFDFKSTITLLASPDEVLSAQTSTDLRQQFDATLESVVKISDTQYSLNYKNASGSITENVTIRAFSEKGGVQFIEEDVNNGEYQRYYEVATI
jgi:hypothetical protein